MHVYWQKTYQRVFQFGYIQHKTSIQQVIKDRDENPTSRRLKIIWQRIAGHVLTNFEVISSMCLILWYNTFSNIQCLWFWGRNQGCIKDKFFSWDLQTHRLVCHMIFFVLGFKFAEGLTNKSCHWGTLDTLIYQKYSRNTELRNPLE